MVFLWVLLTIVAVAIGYLALGGRALLGGSEHPDRLIGTRVQLGQLESGPKGLDPQQPALPPAVVERFIDGVYVLQFERPVMWLGRTEIYATVAARSKGYPVSLAASSWRRTVWVSGRFGSGEAFLGMLRVIALALYMAGIPAVVATQSRSDAATRKLVDAAVAQTRTAVTYDGSYRRIPYPGGDVPANIGVCTDVVVRAYRQIGVDLQVKVHEDMRRAFRSYPALWGMRGPDTNIDHRRVPNLQTFFRRAGAELPRSTNPDAYRPGDVVSWMLPGNLPHIGIVIDQRTSGGVPLVVHNIGRGPEIEDILFRHTITGHYRYNAR